MEGVLVSAKKDGSTITTTVVTDEKGDYSFPAGRLTAGKYTITTRAAGYDLVGPKTAEVPASGAATADLKLAKARSIINKLSSGEWLNSIPGGDAQKAFMGGCVGCHTLQRVLTSTHTAEEFEQVFTRMSRYSPGSQPTQPQPLLPGPRGERPAVTGAAAKEGGRVSRQHHARQSERARIRVQDVPASDRQVDPRHHHRIRPAAQRGACRTT